jgi:hypothetical protein
MFPCYYLFQVSFLFNSSLCHHGTTRPYVVYSRQRYLSPWHEASSCCVQQTKVLFTMARRVLMLCTVKVLVTMARRVLMLCTADKGVTMARRVLMLSTADKGTCHHGTTRPHVVYSGQRYLSPWHDASSCCVQQTKVLFTMARRVFMLCTVKVLVTMWDFKFSRRRVWCSELSSGLYCRVKWLSTDVLEVRTASTLMMECKLMMEAVRTSETSVDNHFTRQYNPVDSSEHHTRRRENLKSHITG